MSGDPTAQSDFRSASDTFRSVASQAERLQVSQLSRTPPSTTVTRELHPRPPASHRNDAQPPPPSATFAGRPQASARGATNVFEPRANYLPGVGGQLLPLPTGLVGGKLYLPPGSKIPALDSPEKAESRRRRSRSETSEERDRDGAEAEVERQGLLDARFSAQAKTRERGQEEAQSTAFLRIRRTASTGSTYKVPLGGDRNGVDAAAVVRVGEQTGQDEQRSVSSSSIISPLAVDGPASGRQRSRSPGWCKDGSIRSPLVASLEAQDGFFREDVSSSPGSGAARVDSDSSVSDVWEKCRCTKSLRREQLRRPGEARSLRSGSRSDKIEASSQSSFSTSTGREQEQKPLEAIGSRNDGVEGEEDLEEDVLFSTSSESSEAEPLSNAVSVNFMRRAHGLQTAYLDKMNALSEDEPDAYPNYDLYLKFFLRAKLEEIDQWSWFVRHEVRQALYWHLCDPRNRTNTHWYVEMITIYGGSANGFTAPGGDLDVTLWVPDIARKRFAPDAQSKRFDKESQNRDRERKALCLDMFANDLQRDQGDNYFDFELVKYAKIPVLKCKTCFPYQRGAEALELDFTVNNEMAVRNTSLLKRYSGNPYCRALAILVKSWTKANNLVGVQSGFLSSYAYNLMVIFFFQCQGILPVLHEDREKHPLHTSSPASSCGLTPLLESNKLLGSGGTDISISGDQNNSGFPKWMQDDLLTSEEELELQHLEQPSEKKKESNNAVEEGDGSHANKTSDVDQKSDPYLVEERGVWDTWFDTLQPCNEPQDGKAHEEAEPLSLTRLWLGFLQFYGGGIKQQKMKRDLAQQDKLNETNFERAPFTELDPAAGTYCPAVRRVYGLGCENGGKSCANTTTSVLGNITSRSFLVSHKEDEQDPAKRSRTKFPHEKFVVAIHCSELRTKEDAIDRDSTNRWGVPSYYGEDGRQLVIQDPFIRSRFLCMEVEQQLVFDEKCRAEFERVLFHLRKDERSYTSGLRTESEQMQRVREFVTERQARFEQALREFRNGVRALKAETHRDTL
ncbi:unnamed protein product [Amoebophrya sp. A120]|nr:unnamed protein product [Amoebophrya sp. A120]|eukprot:GSA120T00020205001.1